MSSKNRVSQHLSLTEEASDFLFELAESEGLSMSAYVETLIRRSWRKHKAEKERDAGENRA